MKLWMLAVVAACGSSSSPTPPASPPEPKPTPAPPAPAPKLEAPTCVPSGSVLEHARKGDAVSMCFQEDDNGLESCWSFDLAAGAWKPVDRRKQPPANGTDAPAPVDVTPQGDAKVCADDLTGCKTFKLPFHVETDGGMSFEVNADRSLLAVVTDAIRVVDVGTGKLVTTIKPWNTPMAPDKGMPASFRGAQFTGDVLVARIADSPITSAFRLFDPRTGKRIGDVTATDQAMADGPAFHLGGNRWVFSGFEKSQLVIVDVTTAKVIERIDIEPVDAGGFGIVELAPDGKAMFAFRGATAFRVELASGKVTPVTAPVCK